MEILAFIIIIVIAVYLIKKYNYFKTAEQQIKREKSGIDVALTRRHDEMQKMQDSVKGIMKHENTTFVDIANIRSGMSIQELLDVETKMNRAHSQLLAMAEAYPELKASLNFSKLQDSIETTELELQAARRSYNSIVTEFNEKVVAFPTNLVAKLFKVETAEVFETIAEKREDFKLEF